MDLGYDVKRDVAMLSLEKRIGRISKNYEEFLADDKEESEAPYSQSMRMSIWTPERMI